MGLPPPTQSKPTRISVTPITVMMVPVTTGGNRPISLLKTGEIKILNNPARIHAPNMPVRPSSGFVPIAIMGVTAANDTPIITGKRIPNMPTPQAWIKVMRPQQSKSALINMVICSLVKPSASPIISGTATAPAYITITCCKPKVDKRPIGNTSSTLAPGTVDFAVVESDMFSLLSNTVSIPWQVTQHTTGRSPTIVESAMRT